MRGRPRLYEAEAAAKHDGEKMGMGEILCLIPFGGFLVLLSLAVSLPLNNKGQDQVCQGSFLSVSERSSLSRQFPLCQ